MLFCLLASVLLRRSHLTPCLGRCGGALKNFILNDLKYDILQSIWRMWPCIRPMEAPGWLMACKVLSVAQVILLLAVCGSLWRVFSLLQPSSPFGSKAIRWMEKAVQTKKHAMSIPQACTQPLFISSRPGNRLLWGEWDERCSTLALQVLASAVSGLRAVAVLEPMLIFTHYMYNLPQICHWNEHALDVYLKA